MVLSQKGANVVVALFREDVRDRLTLGVAVVLWSLVVFWNAVETVTDVVGVLVAIVVTSVVFPEVGAVLWVIVWVGV